MVGSSKWIVGLVVGLCLVGEARAASIGGVDWVAAAPQSYSHLYGGGAYDDGTNGLADDVVSSLQGGNFACGDVVSFLARLEVSATPAAPSSTAHLIVRLGADTTGQPGAALIELLGASVNYGVVEGGDGPGGTDSAIVDDGGSAVVNVGVSFDPTGPYVDSSDLVVELDVTDLEASEVVVVRLDARLGCQPGSSPTGNIQAVLDQVEIVDPIYELIPSGAQTLPFQKVGDLLGAGEAALTVQRTVSSAVGGCPGTRSLTAAHGDELLHCHSISAMGTDDVFDVTAVDDRGTPLDPSDDVTLVLPLVDLDGDGALDDLAAGTSVSVSATYDPGVAADTVWLTTNAGGSSAGGGAVDVESSGSAEVIYQALEASEGAEGGLESNGRLASALADRALRKRFGAQPSHSPRSADPIVMRLLPEVGPQGSLPRDSTPADLPAITNAIDVVGRDYVDETGAVLGSVLVIVSESAVYEHSKALCDRAAGATVEGLEVVDVGGASFVRAVYRNERAGTRDHAMSFKLYAPLAGEDEWAGSSRWLARSYMPVAPTQLVYNVDVWSRSPGDEAWLAATVVGSLRSEWPLRWEPAQAPEVYVSAVRSMGSSVELELGGQASEALEVQGSYLDEEGLELRLDPTAVGLTESRSSEVRRLQLPRFLDVTVELMAQGDVIDQVWVSDGAWSRFDDSLWGGRTEVEDFSRVGCRIASPQELAEVRAEHGPARRLELAGCGSIRAQNTDVAGVGRHLHVAGAPMDLSGFASFSAWVRSNEPLEICLHTGRGDEARARCVRQPAVPEGQWLRWPMPEADPMVFEEVLLVSFASRAEGLVDVEVSHLVFSTEEVELPPEDEVVMCACRSDQGGASWLPLLLVPWARARRRRHARS